MSLRAWWSRLPPTVLMVDDHDGRVGPHHRAVATWRSRSHSCAVAVPARPAIQRWLGSSDPVLSVNEVVVDSAGREHLTRTSTLTLTGWQCRTLYDTGVLELGRARVVLVRRYPPGLLARDLVEVDRPRLLDRMVGIVARLLGVRA